jgi:hypothetical protein
MTAVLSQPGHKYLQDSISMENKLGVVLNACHPSYSGKHKTGESQSMPAWAKSETLSPE